MSDCATPTLRFETPTPLALEAAFDGGRITSDGGLLWLARVDSELGLCQAISECVPEWRKRRGRHPLASLVRQRVFQIACGYEDQNDSDALREDPLLKAVCGSLRFVLTTRAEEPKTLYEFYAKRGETENWIKDLKLHMKADRLSCHRFVANQFRLLLHACAYWLMDTLRKKLIEGGSGRIQLDTLRLSLIKIGGRVRELFTKIRLHLASGHPGQDLWHTLSGAFGGVYE